VTTGAAGTSAAVTNTGTSSAAVLNFTIPRGDPGVGGGGGLVANVINYGADRTGVADSAAAIQACLNANKSAYFPAGSYAIGATINVPGGSTIMGEGYNTELKATGSFPAGGIMFALTGSYNTVKDFLISGNTNNFVFLGDQDPGRTSWVNRWRLSNLICFNLGNDFIRFTGRGLDYIFENLWVDKCQGYGVYLRNITDSNMTNCSFAEGWKSHVDIAGANMRFLQCKFMMQGNWTVNDPYPAVKLYNSLGVVFSACEFQQNQWDALSMDTIDGAIISGCNFDSNNQAGLTGSYASINLTNCHFIKVDALMMDGRDFGAAAPYNSQGLNLVTVDDKSCFNQFNLIYHPYQFPQNGKYKHANPFLVPVNDISSQYLLNNRDYFKFGASDVVIGTNATLSGTVSQSANFTVTPASADNGNRITATQGTAKTAVAGDFYTITIPLTMAQFTGNNSPTNKTMAYVIFECKIYDPAGTSGLQINGSISEVSTVAGHTTAQSTGLVRVGASQNKNATWMPMAMYKPLTWSADTGYQVNILLSGSAGSGTSTLLNAGDVIAEYRNIRIGFF
jgi:hypothetical protein